VRIETLKRILASFLVLLSPALSIAAAMTGGETVYRVVNGDSLLLISAKLGVDTAIIVRENNLDRTRHLQPGQELKLNTRKIAPKTLENGIIIDIPGRMLYYFKSGNLEMSFPVGLGMPQWQGMIIWRTPSGIFTITRKEKDPTWYVPASIQEQMRMQSKPVLTVVPPGPDNPLGRYALYTSLPGIAIHETIWPMTVYGFRSHGCVRVSTQNIEKFFDEVEAGTPGELVYEPVKLAVNDEGKVFLEVDPDVYRKIRNVTQEVMRCFDEMGVADLVDWDKVKRIIHDQSGNAEDITGSPGLVANPQTPRIKP
jgi:L,D-transpeptidase ErfK/SrfK